MSAIQSKLSAIINGNVGGVDGAFSVLSQIGVELVKNADTTDDIDNETLVGNNSTHDETTRTNPSDIRRRRVVRADESSVQAAFARRTS